MLCSLIAAGCSNYKITHPLDQPLRAQNDLVIGSIDDQLPLGKDRPSLEDINKLKVHLTKELEKENLFHVYDQGGQQSNYEIQGALTAYKKGSGVARAFLPFGIGNAKVTLNLELVDKANGVSVFSGEYRGSVSSYAESGEEMLKRVAKDFAKSLRKQHLKLLQIKRLN